MATNASRTPQRENRKNTPPTRANTQRPARPELSIVSAGDSSTPISAASVFLNYEIVRLTAFAEAMRECDAASDFEFQMFFDRGAQPDSTGLERREIAAKLLIAPITIQRWSRGENLPYIVPRRAYLGSLADLITDHVSRLEAHGIALLRHMPRRGERKSRAE